MTEGNAVKAGQNQVGNGRPYQTKGLQINSVVNTKQLKRWSLGELMELRKFAVVAAFQIHYKVSEISEYNQMKYSVI